MEKAVVFIDEAYLSKVSKHFGKGEYIKVDYNQFANTLAKDSGLWCCDVYFYTAPPFQDARPTEEENRRKAGYDKLKARLEKIPNFHVREGRCQKIGSGYKQKGVDTLLTIDMMEIPSDVKKIVMFACDTDFVPVIERVRERGVDVILYYYSDRIRKSLFSMSNHIRKVCSKCILIDKSFFDRSMYKK